MIKGTMFEEFRKAEGHTYGQRNFVLELLKDQYLPITSERYCKMDRLKSFLNSFESLKVFQYVCKKFCA